MGWYVGMYVYLRMYVFAKGYQRVGKLDQQGITRDQYVSNLTRGTPLAVCVYFRTLALPPSQGRDHETASLR